jgi:hypothetical protein
LPDQNAWHVILRIDIWSTCYNGYVTLKDWTLWST